MFSDSSRNMKSISNHRRCGKREIKKSFFGGAERTPRHYPARSWKMRGCHEPLLERVLRRDSAINLTVVQVFGQNLVASGRLGGGKKKRVIELKSVLLPELQRPSYRGSKLNMPTFANGQDARSPSDISEVEAQFGDAWKRSGGSFWECGQRHARARQRTRMPLTKGPRTKPPDATRASFYNTLRPARRAGPTGEAHEVAQHYERAGCPFAQWFLRVKAPTVTRRRSLSQGGG